MPWPRLPRFRADPEYIPSAEAIKYYAQRAAVPGTLLITEATFISLNASGYPNIPGIWNSTQASAWRKITDAVHERGSFIYCQLWYLGRAARVSELAKHDLSLRSSGNIPIDVNASTPRPMTVDEIEEAVREYANAAKTAIEAGFDGVEIHGANGYLIDQYLQTNSNNRTDQYGGSIENRVRFPLAVINAVVEAIGAERVGLRMSPFSSFQGMKMPDPRPTFSHYVSHLPRGLAYIHATEARVSGVLDLAENDQETLDFIRTRWTGPFIVAGGFTPSSAITAAKEDPRTVVALGRYFISNPDLVAKVKLGVELRKYDRKTFYTSGVEGYTDYPVDQDLVHRAFGAQEQESKI